MAVAVSSSSVEVQVRYTDISSSRSWIRIEVFDDMFLDFLNSVHHAKVFEKVSKAKEMK